MSRREKIRKETIEEIKAIAWEMIRADRPIILLEITRQMGMTAPAFYTYFKSRDDLMAALVEDALDSFFQALSAPLPLDLDPGSSIALTFLRYRAWAVDHPQGFGLFAGRPVPGFELDPVKGLAQKGYRLIFDLFDQADRTGLIRKPDPGTLPQSYLAQICALKENLGISLDPMALHLAIRVAGLVHGLISLELSKRFNALVEDGETLFRFQLQAALAEIGIVLPA